MTEADAAWAETTLDANRTQGGRSPSQTAHEAGEALVVQLQDAATRSAWQELLERLAPGLSDWVVEAVFGGTYQRGRLSLRDRQLLNLGALTALGGVEPQLSGHVRTCRRIGMAPEEVTESIAHLLPYVGLPRTIAALRAVDAALDGPQP